MRRWPNAGLMMVQRQRQSTNIKTTLGLFHLFAGEADIMILGIHIITRFICRFIFYNYDNIILLLVQTNKTKNNKYSERM